MLVEINSYEKGEYKIRLAKVTAVRLSSDDENWTIHFEGGAYLNTNDDELAKEAVDFLAIANLSDTRFFNRGS